MKKLITAAVASAFAFLAIGAGNYQPGGTSFESSPSGEKTVEALTAHEDDGVGTGDARYWIYGGGDTTAVVGVVTNGAPVVTSDVPSRPDQFADIANNQYLNLAECEATNVLYRAVKSVAGKTVGTLDGESIGDGFYLDTLVKFTAADSTNNFELASGDKLAITYVEESEDDDEDGVCLSNIVVRAGYVENGTATEKTYIMELPDELKASFVVTNWHRLTVRAIDVGYAAAPVGFVVYLDGCPAPLTYAVGEAAGDSTYTDALAGNAIVNQFLYNSTTHALLPSAVSSGTAKTTLAAVGFMGSGCVDDISFVSGTPGFVEEGKGVAIEWDSGVATVTVRDGDTYYVGSALGGEDVTALAYSATNFTVESSVSSLTVTATYKQGVDGQYEAGTWVTDPVGKYSAATDTLVLEGDNTTLTINSMLPLFQVGETHYGSFAEALAAAVAAGTELSPATIKLLANFEGTVSEPALMVSTGYIVLDLNGKTIQGLNSDYSVANTGASLTIIDSASGGTIAVPQMSDPEQSAVGSLLVYGDTAITVIRAGIFEGVVTVTTSGESSVVPTDLLTVYGGRFYDVDYEEGEPGSVFYLVAYAGEYNLLPQGVTYSYDGGNYFTVSESAPTPTVVQIPTAALNLVYTGNQQTGVAAGEGYTLSGTYAATDAGNYIATATLDQDCVWSDETTAPKEINWSIAADTSATVDVVLTDYEEEYTAQLAFPTASATIGGDVVVGTAAWSPDTITEPAAGATNTYTATFTVTSGNYAGSTGTAEFKVWKAASGGEDWPTDPTTVSGQTAAAAFGISGDLANADAGVLATWAKANSVNYADRTTTILTDAFLLNCANTQEAVDAAKANFKVTAITVVGDTVTITPADAADYGNGKIVIEGAAALTSPMSWHTKTTGDHFFRATLVVKPVTP